MHRSLTGLGDIAARVIYNHVWITVRERVSARQPQLVNKLADHMRALSPSHAPSNVRGRQIRQTQRESSSPLSIMLRWFAYRVEGADLRQPLIIRVISTQ